MVAVKRHGGVTVVQDPDEAVCADMPRSALENVEIDHCLPAAGIGELLARLAHQRVELRSPIDPLLEQETKIALEQEGALDKPPGRPSEFACPACGGVLNEVHEGKLLRFRCRVGHAYTPASLSSEQRLALEGALWASLRALEEQATLNRRLAARARERGQPRSASRFEESCAAAEDQARIVREALSRGSLPGFPDEVPQRDPA